MLKHRQYNIPGQQSGHTCDIWHNAAEETPPSVGCAFNCGNLHPAHPICTSLFATHHLCWDPTDDSTAGTKAHAANQRQHIDGYLA
jgi:hypothetical protein